MKRLCFFMVILAAVNLCSYGQKLIPHVGSNGLVGFVDEAGNTKIPSMYNNAGKFSEGMARVLFNGKWGFIDETGKEVIPLRFNDVEDFSGGIALVRYGKWGAVDKAGGIKIPFIYDNIGVFSEGLVRVTLKNKWGFIDKTGAEIVPIRFEYVNEFKDGVASACYNNKWGMVNKAGAVLVPFTYSTAKDVEASEGAAEAKLAEADKKYDFNEVISTPTTFQDNQSISAETYELPARAAIGKKNYFGLGMGMDYGGFGMKLEYLPVKYLGVFGGVGYNLLSVGWNMGATLRMSPDTRVSPNLIVFYGYNGFVKIIDASQYNMTSYGITIGGNLDIEVGRSGSKITAGLFVPIRSKKFLDHYDTLKNDPRFEMDQELLPVAISIGFNF